MTRELVLALVLAGMLALAGCSSTATMTAPDGSSTVVKAGFGNRLTAPPFEVTPDPGVVAAGERLGMAAIQRANDAIIKQAVEQVTTGKE